MNEILFDIFGIYCFLNFLSLYLIVPVLDANMDDEEKSFWRYVFIYQYSAYQSAKDSINMLGIIIFEILVTLGTFVASIMIFVGMSILETFLAICKLFCWIFKKR